MERSPSSLDGIPGVLEETALYEVANLAEKVCGCLKIHDRAVVLVTTVIARRYFSIESLARNGLVIMAAGAFSLAIKGRDIHKHPCDIAQAFMDSAVERARCAGCSLMLKQYAQLASAEQEPKIANAINLAETKLALTAYWNPSEPTSVIQALSEVMTKFSLADLPIWPQSTSTRFGTSRAFTQNGVQNPLQHPVEFMLEYLVHCSQFCNAIITTELPVLAAAAIDSWLQTVGKRVDAAEEVHILKLKKQLAHSFSSDAIHGIHFRVRQGRKRMDTVMRGKTLLPLRPEESFQHLRLSSGNMPISPALHIIAAHVPLPLPSIHPNELACRAAIGTFDKSWPAGAPLPPPLPAGPHPDDSTCSMPPWLAGEPPLPPPDAPTPLPRVQPPHPAEPQAPPPLPCAPPPLPPAPPPQGSAHVAAAPCSTALHRNGCLSSGPRLPCIDGSHSQPRHGTPQSPPMLAIPSDRTQSPSSPAPYHINGRSDLGNSPQRSAYRGQRNQNDSLADARHVNGATGRDIYPSSSARRSAWSPYQPGPARTTRGSPVYGGMQCGQRQWSPRWRPHDTPPPAGQLPGGVRMALRRGAISGATTPRTALPLAASPSLSCSSGGSGQARSLSRSSTQPVASNGYGSVWGAGLGKRTRGCPPSQSRCTCSPSNSPLQPAPAAVEKRRHGHGPLGTSSTSPPRLAGADVEEPPLQQSKESSLESGEVQSSGSESAGDRRRVASHAGSCLCLPPVSATRRGDRTAPVSPMPATGRGQPSVDGSCCSSSSRSSSSSGSGSSRSGSPSDRGRVSSMGTSSMRSRSPSQSDPMHPQEQQSPSGSHRSASPSRRRRLPARGVSVDSDSSPGWSNRGSSSEASGASRGKRCRSSTSQDRNRRENGLTAKRPRNGVLAA